MIVILVSCDTCESKAQSELVEPDSATDGFDALREEGWTFEDYLALCPTCSAEK
jgi:hypothetical protein